jgi:hypothetical protein
METLKNTNLKNRFIHLPKLKIEYFKKMELENISGIIKSLLFIGNFNKNTNSYWRLLPDSFKDKSYIEKHKHFEVKLNSLLNLQCTLEVFNIIFSIPSWAFHQIIGMKLKYINMVSLSQLNQIILLELSNFVTPLHINFFEKHLSEKSLLERIKNLMLFNSKIRQTINLMYFKEQINQKLVLFFILLTISIQTKFKITDIPINEKIYIPNIKQDNYYIYKGLYIYKIRNSLKLCPEPIFFYSKSVGNKKYFEYIGSVILNVYEYLKFSKRNHFVIYPKEINKVDLKFILTSLQRNKFVTEIHLENCNESSSLFSLLSKIIKYNTSIQKLIIKNFIANSLDLVKFFKALTKNQSIHNIFFILNTASDWIYDSKTFKNFGKDNNIKIMKFFGPTINNYENLSVLTESLKHNSNVIEPYFPLPAFSEQYEVLQLKLVKNLILNTGITTISLNNCFLGKMARFYVHKLILNNNTITDLSICESETFLQDGISLFTEAIIKNTSLKSLNLRGNRIDSIPGTYITRILSKNKNLQNLGLANMYMNSLTCKYLLKGLLKNRSLTEIDLSRNYCEDEGTRVLSFVLKEITSLYKINMIYHNCYDNEEAKINLMNALKENSTLSQFIFGKIFKAIQNLVILNNKSLV